MQDTDNFRGLLSAHAQSARDGFMTRSVIALDGGRCRLPFNFVMLPVPAISSSQQVLANLENNGVDENVQAHPKLAETKRLQDAHRQMLLF